MSRHDPSLPPCLEDLIAENNPVRIVDAIVNRLDQDPETMTIRRATVEHPFGTLKSWKVAPGGLLITCYIAPARPSQ